MELSRKKDDLLSFEICLLGFEDFRFNELNRFHLLRKKGHCFSLEGLIFFLTVLESEGQTRCAINL